MVLMDPVAATLMTAELLGNPMHVASVLVLSPPADAGPGWVDQLYEASVSADLEVDARLRRRAHRGVDTGGLWAWADCPELDLEEHVHRVCLPPGSPPDRLWALLGVVHAQPLDRSRPLWEGYVVDGLEGGRVALYTKIHHAVLDGISGLRLIERSMGTDPDQRGMPPLHALPAQPRARGDRSLLRTLRSVAWLPRDVLEAAGRTALGELRSLRANSAALPFGAPRTRLNGALGPARTFAAASWPQDRLRAVQHAAGVNANDVVTAMVAGALRAWFAAHDELPARSLVAICPVSVRSPGEEGAGEELQNAFGTALCVLGTDLDDPAARLATVHMSMAAAKQQVAELGSMLSLAATLPTILPTIRPPMLPRDPCLPPGYNLPISNVPGPRTELYWNGAHLDELYPASIVYDGMALNVTVCSYADRVGLGFLAGGEVMPDLDSLPAMTEQALQELERAVGLDT